MTFSKWVFMIPFHCGNMRIRDTPDNLMATKIVVEDDTYDDVLMTIVMIRGDCNDYCHDTLGVTSL